MEELKTHELTHVNRQSYKCDNRSFKYAKDSELKPHIKKKHDDKENYSCVKCSEKFEGKDTLKIHKVTHIGQQTYVCDQRSHKYSQNIDLKTHSKREHDARPENGAAFVSTSLDVKIDPLHSN